MSGNVGQGVGKVWNEGRHDMRYMVALGVEVPAERRSELPALLEAEGAHAEEHMRQGIMEAIYVAADRSAVWAVMRADTLGELKRLVAGYPMDAFFTNLTYTPLG